MNDENECPLCSSRLRGPREYHRGFCEFDCARCGFFRANGFAIVFSISDAIRPFLSMHSNRSTKAVLSVARR